MSIRGLKYPLELENGGLKVVSGDELTASWIRHVITTEKFELIMRPTYGVNNELFEPLAEGEVKLRYLTELEKRIPGTKFQVDVELQAENNVLVSVGWEGSDGNLLRVNNGR